MLRFKMIDSNSVCKRRKTSLTMDKLSRVPGLKFNTPDARLVYIRIISDTNRRYLSKYVSIILISRYNDFIQNIFIREQSLFTSLGLWNCIVK